MKNSHNLKYEKTRNFSMVPVDLDNDVLVEDINNPNSVYLVNGSEYRTKGHDDTILCKALRKNETELELLFSPYRPEMQISIPKKAVVPIYMTKSGEPKGAEELSGQEYDELYGDGPYE